MDKNKDWCSFPDEAINNLKAGHAKNQAFTAKACTGRRADQEDEGAGGAGRRRRSAGAAAASRPALSAAPERPVLPDARPASLVLRLTPDFALPFVQLARLDRPAGWQLLLAPCWQGAALAGLALHRGPNLWHLVLFLVGAIVMRGAGCAYNDILDRKLDAGRRAHPQPAAALGPGRASKAAAAFMVALSFIGLAVLLCFNAFSIGLGIASLGIVAVYPLMKRVTSWPQAVLGLAFSWGALMGWARSVREPRGRAGPALPLRLLPGRSATTRSTRCRTRATTPSSASARRRGCSRAARGSASGCSTRAAAALSLAAILLVGGGAIALVGWLAYVAHLGWQVSQVDGADPATALSLFRSNRDAGFMLFAGIAAQGWAAKQVRIGEPTRTCHEIARASASRQEVLALGSRVTR